MSSLFSTLGRTAAVLPLAIALYATPLASAHAAEADDVEKQEESTEISDPLEGFNRAIYGINTAADFLFIGPAATIYSEGVPEPVQGVLGNIVDNLKLPLIAINHLLQGDFSDFGTTVGRFVVNSTVGIAGAMDIATDAGLPERKTDFGITLASWGLDTGPYLVLPLFGPSNLRDGVGTAVDMAGDPVRIVAHNNDLDGITMAAGTVRALRARADADPAIQDIRRNSIDTYATMRSMASQRREADVKEKLAE